MDEKYEEGVAHDKYDVEQMHENQEPHIAKEQEGLKRDLRLRHMVMIAVSGTIGTGLFLTSGQTIAGAGPGGACKNFSLFCMRFTVIATEAS